MFNEILSKKPLTHWTKADCNQPSVVNDADLFLHKDWLYWISYSQAKLYRNTHDTHLKCHWFASGNVSKNIQIQHRSTTLKSSAWALFQLYPLKVYHSYNLSMVLLDFFYISMLIKLRIIASIDIRWKTIYYYFINYLRSFWSTSYIIKYIYVDWIFIYNQTLCQLDIFV